MEWGKVIRRRRWGVRAFLGLLVVLGLVSVLGRACLETPVLGQVSLPGAAGDVTLRNGEFGFRLDTVIFEESTNAGGTGDAVNYWQRRGLDGGKALVFNFKLDHLLGPEVSRSRGVLANVCQIEARYRTRDSGTVTWSPYGEWNVVNWAAWDRGSLAVAGGPTQAHEYGGGMLDAEDYLRGGVVTGITPGGRAESWDARYVGRNLAGRLVLPEEGDWEGVDREFGLQFRAIWGSAANFNSFRNATGGGRNDATWLNIWPPPDAAANNACQFYTQDLEWQAGRAAVETEVRVDAVVPNFGGGARGALRTLGTEEGVRVVVVPGGAVNWVGESAADVEVQWRYLESCGTERADSCVGVPGDPAWGDMEEVRSGAEWRFSPDAGYWRFEYRFKSGYGGGRATEMRFPALGGESGAPVYAGRISPQNRTPWLNQEEYGVTTWYKLGDAEARVAGNLAARWTGGEGELLRGRADADIPGPYADWNRTRSFNINVVQVSSSTLTMPAVRWTNSELQAWLGGDDFLDRNIVAVPAGTVRSAARSESQHWDTDPSHPPDANAIRLRFVGTDNEAFVKEKYRNADERRLFLLLFERCRYDPGAAWDRYAVQTRTAYHWRLFGQYGCSESARGRLVVGTDGRSGTSTFYASAGLEITEAATYSVRAHSGRVGLYSGDDPVRTISGAATGERLAFLLPGVYDVLMERAEGGFFDVELRQTEDSPLTRLTTRPRQVRVFRDALVEGGLALRMAADWQPVSGSSGYGISWSFIVGGLEINGGAMVGGGSNSVMFEVPAATDVVTLRVRALAPDGPGGVITHTAWSDEARWTADRGIVVPTAVPVAGYDGGDTSLQEGVSGLFDIVGLEGVGGSSRVLVMVLCGVLAVGLFGVVMVATGGGATGVLAGAGAGVLLWTGLGPIFFGVPYYLAYGPVGVLMLLGALVALRTFKI